jgi:hypothetical protein
MRYSEGGGLIAEGRGPQGEGADAASTDVSQGLDHSDDTTLSARVSDYSVAARARSSTPAIEPTYMSSVIR